MKRQTRRIMIASVFALLLLVVVLFLSAYQRSFNMSFMRAQTYAAEIHATALATLSQ